MDINNDGEKSAIIVIEVDSIDCVNHGELICV